MEAKLKTALGFKEVKSTGIAGSGCISNGLAYETEAGMIYVKINSRSQARTMFEGELAGLQAILSTNTVRVPKPMTVFDNDSGAALAMEYINMTGLRKYAAKFGELLAKLHLHNGNLKGGSSSVHKTFDDDRSEATEYVDKFGFHITTCCGYIPLDNSWKSDWVEFFAQQRLHKQLQLIESEYGDREAIELWSQLQLKIPSFFQNLSVTPALLHGDLWSGNAAETDHEPVVFDPATFYGHSEFELSIAEMFGGFPRSFYEAYHKLIPKQDGFNKRRDLYQLFHYLNHWNHFGGGYRSSSISTMIRLLR